VREGERFSNNTLTERDWRLVTSMDWRMLKICLFIAFRDKPEAVDKVCKQRGWNWLKLLFCVTFYTFAQTYC